MLLYEIPIPHVPADDFQIVVMHAIDEGRLAVHEIVDDGHLVPAPQKFGHEYRADVSRATSHKHFCHCGHCMKPRKKMQ